MYNDTIKVANKIISDKDLADIFQRMNEEIKENVQKCKQETAQNAVYESEYQNWTTKDFEGTFKCEFCFYDDTNIRVDNYNTFITIFNNRLQEIKNMFVTYRFSYCIKHGFELQTISQNINMDIYEYKMRIDVNLNSVDKKMDDIYELIKQKILNAPPKYDKIIKKKTSITNKIGFAVGVFPSLFICTLLVLVPAIRQAYASTYVLYPVIVSILALIIGNTVFDRRLERLYSTLVPKKKYSGFDYNKGKSIYKDDIDDFLTTSEITIGKNADNVRNRKEIADLEEKYNKYIPTELIAILVLSILMIFVGKLL